MNFDEFRQVSKRTMRFSDEHRANAALGLVGEIGEWLAAPTFSESLKEAGDALFYHGWLYEFYGVAPNVNTDHVDDDILLIAAMIADMVKKEVFHDKPINREAMTKHLSDIYSYFVVNYGDDGLSDIYQANIAKLALRHPIDKGYTNEGQNARADEIVKQCNPCNCDQGGTIQYKPESLTDNHFLECSYCGFWVYDKDLNMAIEKWNSVNIDAPATLDPCGNCGTTEHISVYYEPNTDIATCEKCHVSVEGLEGLRKQWNARQAEIRHDNAIMQHVTEHAQSGNAEQSTGMTFGQAADQVAVKLADMQAKVQAFVNSLMVNQVPTLPLPQQPVLLWIGHRWIEARYNGMAYGCMMRSTAIAARLKTANTGNTCHRSILKARADMKVNGTVSILSKRTRITLRRFILDHGWPESARRLGMNQAYLQAVVRGRKPITNDLMRKLGMIIPPQFATDTEADAMFEQVFKGKSALWKEWLND